MKNRIELRLLGITYNQLENGVYALVLQEVGGEKRMPIIIGYPEAQAIECHLQRVQTPRPLTHDILAGVLTSLEATLDSVDIRKLENGVFAAYLNITDNIGRKIRIDSRSSDAIALAIRVNAPIFTSPEVLEESGFTPDSRHREKSTKEVVGESEEALGAGSFEEMSNIEYEKLSSEELQSIIEKLVGEEKYEEAAMIKKIIDERKKMGLE